MLTAKDILNEVLVHTKLSKNALAKVIGLKRSQNLYDIDNGIVQNISAELSEKIVTVFSEINRVYLQTGKGDLLLEKNNNYLDQRRNLKNNKEYTVPFYDAGATAGNELANTDNAITDPIGTISVGHFLSDAEAAIRIYGNSMMSNYPPGCILGISQLKERIIQPGEVYIVETEEQRIFKRLFYKDDDPDSDVVMCYSDNTMLFEGGARNGKLAYPPFYVPLKSIRKINVVLGVVKRNVNLLIK